jgi:hypothetical protein
MDDISQINPMRWCFEAIMNWKFSKYEDGEFYLIPFNFSAFHHLEIFTIQLTFLLQGGFSIFALLLPWPYLIKRRARPTLAPQASINGAGEERAFSIDSDFGVESGDVVRTTMTTITNPMTGTGINSGMSNNNFRTNSMRDNSKRLSETPQRVSESGAGGPGRTSDTDRGSLHKPALFNRETSITARSQLSINISHTSIHNSLTAFNTGSITDLHAPNGTSPNNAQESLLKQAHGPTVEFRRLNYSIKDAFAPLGVKRILQDVSGQFDWGKLSMILGASQSGRSSLLHILAGDSGLSSEVTGNMVPFRLCHVRGFISAFLGEILFDNAPPNPNIPLWERCALVEAHDEQYRDITVRDAIDYAMMLRCPMRYVKTL